MLLKILLILWVIVVFSWIVSIIIPATRRNGTHINLAVAICILNLVIQVVKICTN